jgi:signal peptidase I
MNGPPSDTREQPHLEFGEGHNGFGAVPITHPAGVDQRRRVQSTVAPSSRRRPDYRLRGLDLGVQDLEHTRTHSRRRGAIHRRRRRRLLLRWLVVLMMATGVALLLRAFVVQPFSVPSAAMAPTLQVGDQILVVKSSLLAKPVARGEIVVYSHLNSFACRQGGGAAQDLVNRVVGLPGETIWSAHNAIFVDRHRLSERGWSNPTLGQLGSTPILRTKIPPGDYFLMGDNRTDSCDSRSFGPISGSSIVGEVKAIVLRGGHLHFHLLSSNR